MIVLADEAYFLLLESKVEDFRENSRKICGIIFRNNVQIDYYLID